MRWGPLNASESMLGQALNQGFFTAMTGYHNVELAVMDLGMIHD